eukprot:TRINITY_DN723_c1_g1_i1.p1 TRINITY_DN723_c1_g1~~TRINITY_DN723_c1_g1_i1.p1  ORF type:complete len:339 (+),score=101.64 TRINITY_DN723_c1_g1_i1:233-1249(+)
MLMKGAVRAKRPFGLLIEIQQVMDQFGSPIMVQSLQNIKAYKILGLLHISELGDDASVNAKLLEKFAIGDVIRAIILFVNPSAERMNFSLKDDKTSRFPLGACSPPRESREKFQPKEIKDFNKTLIGDAAFHNPSAIDSMRLAFGIDENGTLIDRPSYTKDHFWNHLRDVQSKTWANESVTKGISYAKGGDYVKAMECYKQALDVDPMHSDAFVARGAAYANLGKLEEATREFKKALNITPEHQNALKYLQVTSEKIDMQYKERIEETRKIETKKETECFVYADEAEEEAERIRMDEENQRKKLKRERKHHKSSKKEKKSKKSKKSKKQKRELSLIHI